MKSITNKEQGFSMEDFEKGLMLAGYIMPKSVAELEEREALESHEAKNTVKHKNVYFKRVVLAAEVAYKLNQEPSLGRIKFQKLVYLCENAAQMNLEKRYLKQVAGPFDNKFMHTIAKEFEKNRWFEVKKEVSQNYIRHKYVPLENAEGYKTYYERYFQKENEKIQYVIELFRHINTDNTELATTIFACYLELQSKKVAFTWETLLNLFYNWSDKKKRFSENDVRTSFKWLQDKGMIIL